MEIIKYTNDHHKFRQRLRAFIENEIVPRMDQWEKDQIVPKSEWRRMGREGFLCPTVAAEYGGLGADFLYSIILNEEFIRKGFGAMGQLAHNDVIVPYISNYASEEAKRKYLPGCVSGDIITAVAMTEPDAGSDLSSIKSTVTEDGDDVIINGSKIFISNGLNCDLVVFAARDPLVENPYEALSLYMVESSMPGFARGKKLDKMGMKYQDTAEIFLTSCRVPKRNLLGQKGQGFKILMEKLQQERLVVAAFAVNSAEFILNRTIADYKKNSGPGKSIPNSQANRFALVEMATEAKLARTFLDKLVVDHMEGRDVILETSMAKYRASETAWKIANRCLELYQDAGALKTCPITRVMLEIRTMLIFAGTNEVMKTIIGKFMNL